MMDPKSKMYQSLIETQRRLDELKRSKSVEIKERQKTFAKERSERSRKVVLVGEMFMRRLDRGEVTDDEFLKLMDQFLTRQADRALFGL